MSAFKKTHVSDKMISGDDRRVRRRHPNAPVGSGDIVGHTDDRSGKLNTTHSHDLPLSSISPTRVQYATRVTSPPAMTSRNRSISPGHHATMRTDPVPVAAPRAPVPIAAAQSISGKSLPAGMTSMLRSGTVGRTAASPTRLEITEASRRHQRLLENVENTIRNHEELWERTAETNSTSYIESIQSLQEQVHTLNTSLQRSEAARADEQRIHARNTKELQQHIAELKEQLRAEREMSETKKSQCDVLQHENLRLQEDASGLQKHIETLEDDMRTLYNMYQQSTADLEHLAERLQRFEGY